MTHRTIATKVNHKWVPLEIGNAYGDFSVELELSWNDEGVVIELDRLAWFVAQMALHNGVLQADDPQAERPWAMPIGWQQGKLRGAGMLKLDRLWKPKNIWFERVDRIPKAEPEGYTFLNVAQLAMMELTNHLPRDLAVELTKPPANEVELTERLQALRAQLKERPWCPRCPWYRDEDFEGSGTGMLDELIEVNFLDASRLFITAMGFALEQPAWAAAEDAALEPNFPRLPDGSYDLEAIPHRGKA